MLTSRADIRKKLQAGDSVFSRRIIQTALIQGYRDVWENILQKVKPHYMGHGHFGLLFEWIVNEIHSSGEVTVKKLYDKMEDCVREQWPARDEVNENGEMETFEIMLPGYIGVIDHLVAIEMPDKQMISNAIVWLERRYSKQKMRTVADHSGHSSLPIVFPR